MNARKEENKISKTTNRIPDVLWRWMKPFNRRMVRKYSAQFRASDIVLLLTTIGCKSGQRRVTPLQFDELEGEYFIGSARGIEADWFRNIQANPNVEVQIQDHSFRAKAEPVTDAIRIADFLELRLKRRPRMMRVLMRLEGLPANHTRADLEAFAAGKAMVVIRPRQENTDTIE
jgi:deazaflavin-dependent oxidoreductase (nitroreductase family)